MHTKTAKTRHRHYVPLCLAHATLRSCTSSTGGGFGAGLACGLAAAGGGCHPRGTIAPRRALSAALSVVWGPYPRRSMEDPRRVSSLGSNFGGNQPCLKTPWQEDVCSTPPHTSVPEGAHAMDRGTWQAQHRALNVRDSRPRDREVRQYDQHPCLAWRTTTLPWVEHTALAQQCTRPPAVSNTKNTGDPQSTPLLLGLDRSK